MPAPGRSRATTAAEAGADYMRRVDWQQKTLRSDLPWADTKQTGAARVDEEQCTGQRLAHRRRQVAGEGSMAAVAAAAIADSTQTAGHHLCQQRSLQRLHDVAVRQRHTHSWRKHPKGVDQTKATEVRDPQAVEAERMPVGGPLGPADSALCMDSCASSNTNDRFASAFRKVQLDVTWAR